MLRKHTPNAFGDLLEFSGDDAFADYYRNRFPTGIMQKIKIIMGLDPRFTVHTDTG